MTKKFLISGIVAIVLFFTTSFCFAAEENKTSDTNKSDLGSELTQSMNKIEKTADDLINDENDNDKGTAAGAITDDTMNRDYNATKTAVETDLATTTNNMDGTTWMWIILAVVGIVILATVWVYAMQNNGND